MPARFSIFNPVQIRGSVLGYFQTGNRLSAPAHRGLFDIEDAIKFSDEP